LLRVEHKTLTKYFYRHDITHGLKNTLFMVRVYRIYHYVYTLVDLHFRNQLNIIRFYGKSLQNLPLRVYTSGFIV